MHDLRQLTDTQLNRLYCKVWDRIRRCDGYQMFGYDAPTLRRTHPGFYSIIYACRCEALRRMHA